MTEAQVTFAVLSKWGAHPRLRMWRTNTGAALIKGQWVTFGIPGQSDHAGIIAPEGRWLAIEFKRSKGGRQSDEQFAFQQMIERMGGVYILTPSLEAFEAAMARLGIISP